MSTPGNEREGQPNTEEYTREARNGKKRLERVEDNRLVAETKESRATLGHGMTGNLCWLNEDWGTDNTVFNHLRLDRERRKLACTPTRVILGGIDPHTMTLDPQQPRCVAWRSAAFGGKILQRGPRIIYAFVIH